MRVTNRCHRSPLARSLGRARLSALGQRCWRLVPLALICQATTIWGFDLVVDPAAPVLKSIAPSHPIDPAVQQSEYRSIDKGSSTSAQVTPAVPPASRVIDDPHVVPVGNDEGQKQTSSSIVKRNLSAANKGIPIPIAHAAHKAEAASIPPAAGIAPSRLATSDKPQVAVHRELANPAAAKSHIKQVSSQSDLDGMTTSGLPIDPNAHYPTIIYNSPDVTLCIPPVSDSKSSSPTHVMLRKMTGNQAGEEIRAAVEGNRALCRGLDAGMYEVEYVHVSSFVPPRRRIIIELNHEEIATSLPASSKKSVAAKPSNKSVDLMGDGKNVAERMKQSEDLLDRGATYTALREYQSAIRACASRATSTEVGTSLLEFLDNPVGTLTAVSNHRLTMDQIAKCFADQVNHRADLAPAFFGLGRTFQLVESEEKPLISQAASSAEICHLVANKLDPSFAGPMREVGARRLAEGHHLEAIKCLESAIATAADADSHFLLGQVHAAQGNVRSAIASYIEANKLDPRYLPAAYELTRLDLETATRALYPADVAALIERLREFETCDILDLSDRNWAHQEVSRVLWLAREAELNQTPSTAARSITKVVKSLPKEAVATSRAPAMNNGKLSVPDRKLPEVVESNMTATGRRPLAIEVRKNGTLAPVSAADMRANGNDIARLIPAETPFAGSNHPVITPTSGVEERGEGTPIPRASAAWESKVPAQIDSETGTSRKIPVAEAKRTQMQKPTRATGDASPPGNSHLE